jgi:glycosyltransferase involved in cell wall biosynthesis
MNTPQRFVTLSKYPPYRSGHAKQALWNNRALAALTGREQHQVTYCGTQVDPADEAGPGVAVHHVRQVRQNPRNADGHLARTISAELYRVAAANDVDAILTYYIDPHAAIANRVADALRQVGKRPVVIHSIEGTDLVDSMCEHVEDGLASVLIGDVLRADVVCTVSNYVASRFLATVEEVTGPSLPASLADTIQIRYPGLPPAAFDAPSADALAAFRASHGFRQDSVLVSTFGRLEPEKGLETIIGLAEMALQQAPELEFAIGGAGSLAEGLQREGAHLPNLKVLAGIDYETAQCLRAASAAGVFPTKIIQGFVETFCISALEYEALGVPILATAVGGVPEATPGEVALVPPDSPVGLWWNRLTELLACRTAHSTTAREFARNFTSARSAARILDIAALGSARRAAPMKAFLPGEPWRASHPLLSAPGPAAPPDGRHRPCPTCPARPFPLRTRLLPRSAPLATVPLDNGSASCGHRERNRSSGPKRTAGRISRSPAGCRRPGAAAD